MSRDITDTLRRAQGQTWYDAMTSFQEKTLPPAAKQAPIPPRVGQAVSRLPAVSGGAASPLTETDYASREYHEVGIKTTDGLFELKAIKKLVMTGADGSSEVRNFAAPPVPPAP